MTVAESVTIARAMGTQVAIEKSFVHGPFKIPPGIYDVCRACDGCGMVRDGICVKCVGVGLVVNSE